MKLKKVRHMQLQKQAYAIYFCIWYRELWSPCWTQTDKEAMHDLRMKSPQP